MILVDTHVVVWLAFDQQQISKNARAAIDEARQKGEGLAISDVTLLELTTLTSQGRIRLNISLESLLARDRGTVHCPNLGRGLRITQQLTGQVHRLACDLGIKRSDILNHQAVDAGYAGAPCKLCDDYGLLMRGDGTQLRTVDLFKNPLYRFPARNNLYACTHALPFARTASAAPQSRMPLHVQPRPDGHT